MSTVPGPVPDGGLQAERTALAWRRTALAMAVAAVGAGRLAAPVLGALALVLAGAGLLQAVAAGAGARRRHREVRASLLTRGDLSGVPGGGLPVAALAAAGVLTGLLALAFVLGPG
ncbi:DUF202 domain-containing protein [Geodermatophilus sp. SYSU D01106]|uniref:DUF202 domain-containing protein n=1 Tax=Geodermatophilus sp. FMUSA9-8 TaxID=3120155 RepID=UPI0030088E9D